MYAPSSNSRPKVNHNRVASSPILSKTPQKIQVKLGNNNKPDNASIESNYSTTTYQSHLEIPSSTLGFSLNQSSHHHYPHKSLQLYESTHSLLTANNYLNTSTASSLTQRTESIIEKMEKFELKLQESKKIIENLKKERTFLMTQANRIDEMLTSQTSPTQRKTAIRAVHSPVQSPVKAAKTQSGGNSRPISSKPNNTKTISVVPPILIQTDRKLSGPLSARTECSTTRMSRNKSSSSFKKDMERIALYDKEQMKKLTQQTEELRMQNDLLKKEYGKKK